MKKQILTLFVFLTTCSLFSQELPQPSPKAVVEQRIGLTDVTITYSRPGVKGRVIWGELVPYDEMWRTGANKAVEFKISDAIDLNGTKIDSGTYSLFGLRVADSFQPVLYLISMPVSIAAVSVFSETKLRSA
jgi:hypothetical protein